MPFVPVRTIPAAANRRGRSCIPFQAHFFRYFSKKFRSYYVQIAITATYGRPPIVFVHIHLFSFFGFSFAQWTCQHNALLCAFFLRLPVSQKSTALQFSHSSSSPFFILAPHFGQCGEYQMSSISGS